MGTKKNGRVSMAQATAPFILRRKSDFLRLDFITSFCSVNVIRHFDTTWLLIGKAHFSSLSFQLYHVMHIKTII